MLYHCKMKNNYLDLSSLLISIYINFLVINHYGRFHISKYLRGYRKLFNKTKKKLCWDYSAIGKIGTKFLISYIL